MLYIKAKYIDKEGLGVVVAIIALVGKTYLGLVRLVIEFKTDWVS